MAELRWLDLGRTPASEGFVRALARLPATKLLGVSLGNSSVSEEAVGEARRARGASFALLLSSTARLLTTRASSSLGEGDVDRTVLQ